MSTHTAHETDTYKADELAAYGRMARTPLRDTEDSFQRARRDSRTARASKRADRQSWRNAVAEYTY